MIQLLRAGIMFSLWWMVAPGDNTTLFQMINGLSIIITAIILLLYFKPSLNELGLNWDDIKIRTRILYALGVGLLIFLVFTPYTFSWEVDVLVMGIIFGLIVPGFEEFMFRGYIWNRIENSSKMVNSGVLTWITVTLLFSIWHLGYLDVFLIHPNVGHVNLTMILVSKHGNWNSSRLYSRIFKIKNRKNICFLYFPRVMECICPINHLLNFYSNFFILFTLINFL